MSSYEFPKPLDYELNCAESGYAIVCDGDTAPKAISSGQYLFIKNHSTLATGGYHATAAIASGADLTSSNTAPDADGIANALNSNITNISTPEAVTFTPVANVSVALGGAFKVGKVVFVNFRLNVTSAIANGICGTFSVKPSASFASQNLVGVAACGRDASSNNIPLYAYIGTNGDLAVMGTGTLNTPVGYHMITAVYACD